MKNVIYPVVMKVINQLQGHLNHEANWAVALGRQFDGWIPEDFVYFLMKRGALYLKTILIRCTIYKIFT